MFHYRPLFLSFFSSFQQLRVKHALYNFCQWLDSNCGPLVSEAIALTTELDEFSQLVLSLKFRRKFNLNMLEGLLVWPTGKMQGKSIQESRSSFRVSFFVSPSLNLARFCDAKWVLFNYTSLFHFCLFNTVNKDREGERCPAKWTRKMCVNP